MIALNRAWIASSASPHVIRSKRPSARAPTRRSGVRRRPAPWTNAGYACGTFAQSTPPVYGLASEPRIPTIRSSSTVTVRLHVSGQSSGQTLGRSTLTPAIVLESGVTEEGGPRAGARAAQAPLGRPRPPQPAPRLRERLGVRRVGARGGQAWLRHGRLLGALGARVEPLDAGGHPGPARGGRGRSPDRARALRRRCARPLRARAHRPWAEGRHLAPRRRGLGKLLEHPGPALRRDVPAQAPARTRARPRLGTTRRARPPHANSRPRARGATRPPSRSR